MYCPKCGNQVNEHDVVCNACGLDLRSIQESNVNPVVNPIYLTQPDINVRKENKTLMHSINLLYFGLAVIVLIMFLMAANIISKGGFNISQIQSVGGKTLDEAYYVELGQIYTGYAMITRALGVVFAAILAGFGLRK